jgi:diguanylate cyclase (GGDEF)-like protein/PAS domain S-box-containing protein
MQSKNVRVARASLIALALIIPALYIGFAYTSIVQDREAMLEKAALEARSTSAALNEHANRALGEADRFLLAAIDDIKRSGLSATVDNRAALQALLRKYSNTLPQVLIISLVDASGLIVARGADGPASVNVGDREYFRYHIVPGNTGLFISRSFRSRFSPQSEFTLSRSVDNADGSMNMMLVAGMPVSYFETFYHSLNIAREARMLLLRSDGALLADSARQAERITGNIVNAPLLAHYRQAPSGSFETDADPFGGSAGAPSVVGYTGSADHSILAAVALSRAEVLAPWRKRVEQSGVVGLFAIGLLLTLIALLWRRLSELLQGQADLEEKNASLALAAQVFEASLHAIAILSAKGTILRVNQAFSTITGYAANEVAGRNVALFDANFPQAGLRATIMRSLAAGGAWNGEVSLLTRAGDELTVRQSASLVRDADGAVRSVVAILQDITEQKVSERKLHQLAHFDMLTNLPNRRTFSDRIQHEIDGALRRGTMLAVVFIDVDRFKAINDSLGHAIGDLVLQEVAARLSGCLRRSDTVARIGGDEFVVLLEGNSKIASYEKLAAKLAAALKPAIDVSGAEIYVAASMGISVFPKDGADSETLLRNADTAMYRAKTAGRNCWRFFDESMAQNAVHRLALETALRRAVERNELVLHYQPQRSLRTECIVGVEALLRWERPGHGLIAPAEFIALAEESGLIIPLGEWVLLSACAQAAAWRRENGIALRIAVNIAAKQIHHGGFVDLVSDILSRTGLPPALLELEITESSIIENLEETVSKLHRLKALGVTVAIDDFGTGYSSLSYLKQLPVDRLKIDKSFVKDTPDNADDCAIVRTIISMSHNLGLAVIAEGVESERQRDFLRAERCDEIQGYLLSMPLPARQMTGMLLAGDG